MWALATSHRMARYGHTARIRAARSIAGLPGMQNAKATLGAVMGIGDEGCDEWALLLVELENERKGEN